MNRRDDSSGLSLIAWLIAIGLVWVSLWGVNERGWWPIPPAFLELLDLAWKAILGAWLVRVIPGRRSGGSQGGGT